MTTAKLLTVAQVAKVLDRHEKLVYRWISEGRLHAQKYGASVLVDAAEVARFKKQQPARLKRGGRK